MKAVPVPIDDDVLVTAEGYGQLCEELEALRTSRREELTERLRAARDDHDPESPALFELLEEQAQLERRIGVLEAQRAAARVAEPAADGTAGIGSLVRVRRGDGGEIAEYELVGAIESGVGNGRVSIGSPVGRALVGRRRGDTVAVETPRGPTRLEVLDVRSPRRARAAA
jgi:transcription elongation factor GreA